MTYLVNMVILPIIDHLIHNWLSEISLIFIPCISEDMQTQDLFPSKLGLNMDQDNQHLIRSNTWAAIFVWEYVLRCLIRLGKMSNTSRNHDKPTFFWVFLKIQNLMAGFSIIFCAPGRTQLYQLWRNGWFWSVVILNWCMNYLVTK
jgi:magnesium-transporting ATPase (P-type)